MTREEFNLLSPFVGGVWFFRFACFETGPDWYYLFRNRIHAINLATDGGISMTLEDIVPNRFQNGEWTHHPSNRHEDSTYSACQVRKGGKLIEAPCIIAATSSIILVRLDSVAEGVAYRTDADVPDDTHVFRDFSVGHESVMGLGGIVDFGGLDF